MENCTVLKEVAMQIIPQCFSMMVVLLALRILIVYVPIEPIVMIIKDSGNRYNG